MFGDREAALRREMQVTMQRVKETPGKEPGTGNIRGIGAERRVDGKVCEGGTMDRKFIFSFLNSMFLRMNWSSEIRKKKRRKGKKSQKSSPGPRPVPGVPGEGRGVPAMKNPAGFLLRIELATSSDRPVGFRGASHIHQTPVGAWGIVLGAMEGEAWT